VDFPQPRKPRGINVSQKGASWSRGMPESWVMTVRVRSATRHFADDAVRVERHLVRVEQRLPLREEGPLRRAGGPSSVQGVRRPARYLSSQGQ
jgi:hypothetical protein